MRKLEITDDNAKVGDLFYGYYFGVTNKGNAIYQYTGILTVELMKLPIRYDSFKTIETTKKGKIKGCDCSSWLYEVFLTKEEAIREHDKALLRFGEEQKSDDRDKIYAKIINKDLIEISNEEKDAMIWLSELQPFEKERVKWIRDYYRGEIK